MKVAFFLPHFSEGGVEKSTTRIATEFLEHGHEVDLVVLRPRGVLLENLPKGIAVVRLGSRRSITSVLPLARYLRRSRPDALISAQHFANIAAVLARELSFTRPRLVLTERLSISEMVSPGSRLKGRMVGLFMRLLYRRADAVTAISEDGARELAEYLRWSKEKVQHIYNPMFHPSVIEDSAEPLDHPWFQPDQRPVVLGVGRLTYQKDFHMLIRAFAGVRKSIECRLVILGDGEDRAELDSLARELGVADDVEFEGFVTNPYKYMRRAAVVAVSSRFEGLCNVLIEAQACGTPVVSTDCPVGPREILLDGAAGRLVPVEDPAAMAGAIAGALTDEAGTQEMVRNATENLDRFSPATCFDSYYRLVAG